MERVFLSVLNMSLAAGAVILLILAARLLLRRAPRRYAYALWMVALFRLLCPVSFESALSLLWVKPRAVAPDILYAAQPQINTGLPAVDATVNAVLPPAAPTASVNPLQVWIYVGMLLWLAGAAGLLLYSAVSYIRLALRVRGAVRLERAVYDCGRIDTAFVLGLFRPRVYLPAGITERQRQYILLHERTHIRRGDPWIKLVWYAALCLHWFNPIVWLGFMLMTQDMEASCDEAVLRRMPEVQADYAQSLLCLSTAHGSLYGAPVAFGESGVKKRIQNVLRFKKPAVWVTAVGIAAVAVLTVCLAANPRTSALTQPTEEELALALSFRQADNEADYAQHRDAGSFCLTEIDVLHVERGQDRLALFLWERAGQFAQTETDSWVEDGGHSIPCRLTLRRTDTGWEQEAVEYAGDGTRYQPSVEAFCVDFEQKPIGGLAETMLDYPDSPAYQQLNARFEEKAGRVMQGEAPPFSSAQSAARALYEQAFQNSLMNGDMRLLSMSVLPKAEAEALPFVRNAQASENGTFAVVRVDSEAGGAQTAQYILVQDRGDGLYTARGVFALDGTALAAGSTAQPAPALYGSLRLPVDEPIFVTASFGWRTLMGRMQLHTGIDYAGADCFGKNVYAAADGEVTFAGEEEAYGNSIRILHPNGLETLYAHNAENLVCAGDRVNQGQAIATIGSSGSATGPQLHFEVRRDGVPEDPNLYLQGAVSPDAPLLELPVVKYTGIAQGFSIRHPGVSFAASEGTAVVAAAAGTVVFAGEGGGQEDSAYGLYVLLDHGDGLCTLYAHNAELLVQAGETVAQGDAIARVGATGRVSEPQLYFAVTRDGVSVDPTAYLTQNTI